MTSQIEPEVFYVKRGETFKSGFFTLYGKSGAIQDLTQPAMKVTITIRRRGTNELIHDAKQCNIEGTAGQVTVNFLKSETENMPLGFYVGEFNMTYTNSITDDIYFPSDRKGFPIILGERTKT